MVQALMDLREDLAFALCKVEAMEDSRQRRDMI